MLGPCWLACCCCSQHSQQLQRTQSRRSLGLAYSWYPATQQGKPAALCSAGSSVVNAPQRQQVVPTHQKLVNDDCAGLGQMCCW